MKKPLLLGGVVFLVVFLLGWSWMLGEKIDCSTMTKDDLEKELLGCNSIGNLGDGMVVKVANLRHYYFLFNKFLLVDLVQNINGVNRHSLYFAKVFNESVGIQVHVNNSRSVSTDPTGKNYNFSLEEFKDWLDKNNFKNKQVAAMLFTNQGEKIQYFTGITVYKGDVAEN